MKWHDYLLLYLVGLLVFFGVSAFQSSPGYMDSDYYYTIGLRIATNNGLTEPFLWNYLDNPTGLPHPSNAYWMPFTSLLVALLTIARGIQDFKFVQLGFIFISALISPLTTKLSYNYLKNRWAGFMAGILSIFSGFYLVYMSTTDSIGVLMVLGLIFMLLIRNIANPNQPNRLGKFFLLGITAGCMHLTRADGVVWLLTAGYFGITFREKSVQITRSIKIMLSIVGGYLIVMGPWMVRNMAVFGSIFAGGGSRTLWLTKYDQIFSYPSEQLSFSQWWSSGLIEILRVRLWALTINLQSVLAVEGMIFLFPLILLGVWRLINYTEIRLGVMAWLLIFMAMTGVLPFVGVRGGLLHSMATLQPLFFAVAPMGLAVCVEWGERKRNWSSNLSFKVFSVGIVLLAILLSFIIIKEKIIGTDLSLSKWDGELRALTQQETTLRNLKVNPEIVIMVNNPPGFYLSTGRPSIVIPYGDIDTIITVAHTYDAQYVLIDKDYSDTPLGMLYKNPGDYPGLELITQQNGVNYYKITTGNGK